MSRADAEMALRIVDNAKGRRPTICNALDTVLVHRDIAASWLPKLAAKWGRRVEMHADPEAARLLRAPDAQVRPASAADWGKEFLSLVAAVKVVDSLDAALEHIRKYGSGHSEAIVTGDPNAADRFLREVDAAAGEVGVDVAEAHQWRMVAVVAEEEDFKAGVRILDRIVGGAGEDGEADQRKEQNNGTANGRHCGPFLVFEY